MMPCILIFCLQNGFCATTEYDKCSQTFYVELDLIQPRAVQATELGVFSMISYVNQLFELHYFVRRILSQLEFILATLNTTICEG